MIVKRLYRKVKCKSYDKERREFKNITIKDYIGWFLFNIIPIYLIQITNYERFNDTNEEKCIVEKGVYKDYGHLVRK